MEHVFRAPIDYWVNTEVGRRVFEFKVAAGLAIRERRRKLGLTQQALAHRLGTSQGRVSQVERCRGQTSLDFAVAALVARGASNTEIAAVFTARSYPVAHMRDRGRRIIFVSLKRKSLRKQIQTNLRARLAGWVKSRKLGK